MGAVRLTGIVAALLLCAAGCGPREGTDSGPGTDAGTDSGPTACIGAELGVCALAGIDPDLPYDDLAPIADIVGSATVVGLGESVHRSGGLLTMKGRLIRYFVEELGFRVVAFETEWTRASIVSDYLTTCTGTPEQAVLDGIRDTWTGQSIADLLQWLCDWNQANAGDPVSFFGFNDFQPWDDFPALTTFINDHLPAEIPLLTDIAMCEGVSSVDETDWEATFPDFIADPAFNSCVNALNALDAAIDADEANLLVALSPRELATVRMHVLSLRSFEEYYYWETQPVPNPNGLNSRDAAMAELFWLQWEMDFPGTRVVFSAHNGHVNHGSDTINTVYPAIAKMGNVLEGSIRMGNHLETRYADDYVPIGLHCYNCGLEGQFITKLPAAITTASGNPILETHLDSFGYPYLVADLNPPAGEPSALVPGQVYGLYWPLGWTIIGILDVVPADLFDALIFMNESPVWTPL